MIKQEYIYKAHVVDVYDGDTITVDVDLGFGMIISKMKIRLSHVNAPEIKGSSAEAGLKSKNWLMEKIMNKDVIIKTEKDKTEIYGRYLADVYIGDLYINEMMLNEGMAKKYK